MNLTRSLFRLAFIPLLEALPWHIRLSAGWGGDPLFLSYWMNQSGLTDLLKSMQRPLVYVGVSAGM
jgi:hypothetical protein